MTDQELLKLIADLESDHVERTTSTRDTGKFCEAICAFCNDMPGRGSPGYLILGVENDGKLAGLKVTDELLLNLSALRSDGNIQPMPRITVQKYVLPGGEVAVVEAFPAELPPVRYKGRIWIRVGPSKRIANEGEERALSERRTAAHRSFDAQPCPDCSLNDLALELFLVTYRTSAIAAEILAENRRDLKVQLASLRFYDLAQECATYAGALLFGKDPLQYIPGAYLQFVRFNGVTLTDDVQNEREFSGDLLSVLRELNAFLPLQIQSRPGGSKSIHENQVVDYPVVALKELLMNAVMHRTYESNAPVRFYWFNDRVEIQSPGGLYGEATPENFPLQNSYRNPVVAEAMKVLGYVNKFGRGILRAQEALASNGNPKAGFTFQPTYFLATVRRST